MHVVHVYSSMDNLVVPMPSVRPTHYIPLSTNDHMWSDSSAGHKHEPVFASICQSLQQKNQSHDQGCVFFIHSILCSLVFELTISAGERPAAAHLLRSWVRIPPGAWIFVCCECRMLSSRGLCDELITRPEESYLLCCVVVCDLETSRIVAPYIYDISHLRVNNLTLILLTWRKWWANNASK